MERSVNRRGFLKGASAAAAVAGVAAVFRGTGVAAAGTTGGTTAGTTGGTTIALDVDDTSDAIFYLSNIANYNSWDQYYNWHIFTDVPNRYNGTTHAYNAAGARLSYTHARCTRIQWRAATDTDKGIADVYLDGKKVSTVDQYSPSFKSDVVLFDSGELPIGSHTIAIVVTGRKNSASTGSWVGLDRLRVDTEPGTPERINDDNVKYIVYSGYVDDNGEYIEPTGYVWHTTTSAPGLVNGDAHYSNTQGATADFAFVGSTIRWLGSRQPNGGIAKVYIDDKLEATIDTYQAGPQAGAVLFEKSGLSTDEYHHIRVEVTGTKNAASADYYVYVDAFDCDTSAVAEFEREIQAGLSHIKDGTKPYLAPSTWKPVAYQATMPATGVTLLTDDHGNNGPIKTGFEGNIHYLKYCFSLPNWVEGGESGWVQNYPDSNEGRMLRGAGHALRWTEDAGLRDIVNTICKNVAARQQPDGFAMLWPETEMPDRGQPERANYDRAMWTRGMVAAIMAGNGDAGPVLRRFYDWFDKWVFNRIADPTHPKSLLECSAGYQGHAGSTLTYFSPVGVPNDLVAAERYYIQDAWLQQWSRREALSLWKYPLNRPSCYEVIVGEAVLDHYRATGADKFLEATRGMWDIMTRDYLYPGGGTAINEQWSYPPQSYFLRVPNHNNETCGIGWWANFNARFLQLFPEEEKYAAEIERAIYNTALAFQESGGNHRIRYHNILHWQKEGATAINTCCEGTGTQLLSEMPQFLYSVAPDGLYVNMYESSRITWQHQGPQDPGAEITLTTSTRFPYGMAVQHTVNVPRRTDLKIRIRIPSWATRRVRIHINDHPAGWGQPGTYLTLERGWADGDTISYELPAGFRLIPYTGYDQVSSYRRYALQYGPILYALAGSWEGTYRQPGIQHDGSTVPRLELDPGSLIDALSPTGKPMEYGIAGSPGLTYRPYWLVQQEIFSCFPIIQKTLRVKASPSSVFVPLPGNSAAVSAQVTNPLSAPATDVSLDLQAPKGWTATRTSTGPATLKPGGSGSWAWQITAPATATPGLYSAVLTLHYTSGRSSDRFTFSHGLSIWLSDWAGTATMTASSTFGPSSPANLNDGNTDSSVWGGGGAGGWNDDTAGVFPDWVTATWSDPVTLSRVVVYTLDSARYPASHYGVRDYDVQVLTANGDWKAVAQVRGNTAGVVTSTFPVVQTTALRILILDSNDHTYSRLLEVEAFTN